MRRKTIKMLFMIGVVLTFTAIKSNNAYADNALIEESNKTKVNIANIMDSNNKVSGSKIVKLTETSQKVKLKPSESQQLRVMATYEDGSEKDITADEGTIYKVLKGDMITVDNKGLVTVSKDAKASNQAIVVHNSGMEINVVLNIVPEKPKKAIKLIATPEKVNLKPGESQQLRAIATYEDGSEKDVTTDEGTTYKAIQEDIVSVDNKGLITVSKNAKLSNQLVEVHTNDMGINVVISVVPETQVKISKLIVTPEKVKLKPGESQQVKVIAIYEDGSEKDVTQGEEIKYESNDETRIKIDANGLITTPKNGKLGFATVSVGKGNCWVNLNVEVAEVKPLMIKNLKLIPEKIKLNPGESQQVKVIAIYEDGSERDVTQGQEVTYESNDETRIKIDSNGLITTPKNGKLGFATVSVGKGHCWATLNVEVREEKPLMIKNLKLMPERTTLKVSESQQLKLIAIYEDGSEKDITEEATEWSLNNAEVIELNRETFYVKGLKKGVATIKVWVEGYGDFPAECQVTVVDNKEQNGVLNIEPEKDKIKLNELVTANLVMDNIENIAAEDVVIKYDSEKLKFVDMKEVDGIKLVKNDIKAGELRFILASKGKNNIVNAKKTLLKLNFQGVKRERL